MADYTLIRSRRKTISLSVSEDLRVIVRAPMKMPARDIESFIAKHSGWIDKQKCRIQAQSEGRRSLSAEEIAALREKAKLHIPRRVSYFAEMMGLYPSCVKITSAATRWGSCSAKNSLNFSYRLMLLPDELIDYIIVHELAHIKEKNHSERFYAVVRTAMPDYKGRQTKLRTESRGLPK